MKFALLLALTTLTAHADSMSCKIMQTVDNGPTQVTQSSAAILKYQYQTVLDEAIAWQEARVKISLVDTQLHVAVYNKGQIISEWKHAFSTDDVNRYGMTLPGTKVWVGWVCTVTAVDLKGPVAQAVHDSYLRDLYVNADSLATYSKGDYKDTAICAYAVRMQDDFNAFTEIAKLHKTLLGEALRANIKQIERHMKIVNKNCLSTNAPFLREELAKAAGDTLVTIRQLYEAF